MLDTNRLTDFFRGDEEAVDKMQIAEKIFLPVIVLGEMRAGFLFGRTRTANEARLTEFLNSRRVAILAVESATSHHYAGLFADLRQRGTPIPQNDLWIAALALQHALPLYSRDVHFQKVPQLKLL